MPAHWASPPNCSHRQHRRKAGSTLPTVLSSSPSFARFSNEPVRLLESLGYELVKTRPDPSEAELVTAVQGKDALIVGLEPFTEQVLRAADRARIICKHGVGVDNIDVKAATAAGIPVVNVPAANNDAVADLTFALMLNVARSLSTAEMAVKRGEWPRMMGTEVWRKTLGIIGTGRIGRQVARRARGFEMKILAYDIYPDQGFASEFGVSYVPLQKLLRQSDFVSIHIPLTEQTRGLISHRELAMMKPEAYLFNLSRGTIVDEDALYQALASKQLAGAGLDVFASEPPGREHPLLSLPDFIGTPHMGAFTREAMTAVGMETVENLHRALTGERPRNLINPEVWGRHRK